MSVQDQTISLYSSMLFSCFMLSIMMTTLFLLTRLFNIRFLQRYEKDLLNTGVFLMICVGIMKVIQL